MSESRVATRRRYKSIYGGAPRKARLVSGQGRAEPENRKWLGQGLGDRGASPVQGCSAEVS